MSYHNVTELTIYKASVLPLYTCEVKLVAMNARNYNITLNDVSRYDALKNYLINKAKLGYYIAAKESTPTTGHEHIHIYNIEYIKKDGNILEEIGNEPRQGLHSTVSDLISVKDPSALNPIELNRWLIARNLSQRFTVDSCYKPDVKIYYIWGSSGIGKSRPAMSYLVTKEFDRVKFLNNFWIGVSSDGQSEACIYDDFRDSHMHPSEFISFIDYYVNTMNIKNRHVFNHYKLIIITSVQDPNSIYSKSWSEESRQQWLGRMEIIHLDDEQTNSPTESITELASTWQSVTSE
ncbi:hypothetical protein ENUP19_0021G0029 [Entamoeba nuttalli]|uniref:Replication-associated protein n=1 Tax=Entamoeba nuttalli TaxID=412467 RepID=A0ABQ0D940_9EUKA